MDFRSRAAVAIAAARTYRTRIHWFRRYAVMKYLPPMLCLLPLTLAGCLQATGGDWPAFVDRLILQFESEPLGNPPRSIWQYDYGGRKVFYIPPVCCDVASELYDSDGGFVCRPDGGLTGRGDGKCPDFFSERTHERRIWIDRR
jgi:hypothetical protein